MNIFRLIKQAAAEVAKKRYEIDEAPQVYLDEDESDGVFNVYRFTTYPDIAIFMNVPENRATITVELEEGTEEEDGVYLSSERFEDWGGLEERVPFWTTTLRQIETMYRHLEEDMDEHGINLG